MMFHGYDTRLANVVAEGGWETIIRPLMRNGNQRPLRLLESTARLLQGNARFALTQRGAVFLYERRIPAENDQAPESGFPPVLRRKRSRAEPPLSASEIETTLAACTPNWACRDDGWIVSGEAGAKELTVRQTPTGVVIDAVLAHWEGDLGDLPREAMAHFLCLVHGVIRFARCRIESGSAHVASCAAASRLDRELPDSLASVAHAHRILARDVQALKHAGVATAYLETVASRYGRPEH